MRLIISGFLVFMHTIVAGQTDSLKQALVPDRAIKVSPLHLLNFYPSIEVSYEQRIRPRLTAQLEVGYVRSIGSEANERIQNKQGIKLKLEGRYYMRPVFLEDRIHYYAIEPYMNAIDFDRRFVVQECLDLECRTFYTRQFKDKGTYREQGASLKIGTLRYIDTATRIFIDFNTGFTIRNIQYQMPARREGFRVGDDPSFFDIPNEEDRVAVSPCLGLRFGFRFN